MAAIILQFMTVPNLNLWARQQEKFPATIKAEKSCSSANDQGTKKALDNADPLLEMCGELYSV